MRYLLISAILIVSACSHQSKTSAINSKDPSITDTTIFHDSTVHQLQIVDTTLHFDNIADFFKYRDYIKDTLAAIRHEKKLSDFEKEKIFYDNSILLWKLSYNYFKTCDKNNYENFNFLGLALARTYDSAELKKMWQLFNSFPEKYKNSPLGRKDKAILLDSPHNINRSLSPLANTLYESKEKKQIPMSSIIDHQHRYYIILFTASWCSPCRYYATYFKDTLQNINGKNVKVISISIDKSREKWVAYLKEANYNWYNSPALNGWNSKIAKYLNLQGIPTYLLVSKDGNILEQETGYRMKEIIHRINTSNTE